MTAAQQLVPVEPTREMWAAMGNAVVHNLGRNHDTIAEAVWKAALGAAPKAVDDVRAAEAELGNAMAEHGGAFRHFLEILERRDDAITRGLPDAPRSVMPAPVAMPSAAGAKLHKGRITGWYSVRCAGGNGSDLGYYIVGTLEDHPEFGGQFTHTSLVVKHDTDSGEIETENSRYTLTGPENMDAAIKANS